jgi:hypothetical protein
VRVVTNLLKSKLEVDLGTFGCDENARSARRERNIECRRKVKLIHTQRHVTSIKYFHSLECTRHDVPACVSLSVGSARRSTVLHKLYFDKCSTSIVVEFTSNYSMMQQFGEQNPIVNFKFVDVKENALYEHHYLQYMCRFCIQLIEMVIRQSTWDILLCMQPLNARKCCGTVKSQPTGIIDL